MLERTEPTETELAAGEWLARMCEPEVSIADRRRFEAWLAEDPSHGRAYEALERTWCALEGLDDSAHAALDQVGRTRAGAGGGRGPRGRAFGAAFGRNLGRNLGRPAITVGAALALAAAAIGALYLARPTHPPTQLAASTYETAIGEHESVTLEDGSTIELNAATRVEIAFSADERRVALSVGTALFDVAHNPERPFTVETPQGAIIVRGTAFIVDVRDEEVRTTVLRGVVEAEGPRSWNPLEAPRHAIVRANEEVALTPAAFEVTQVAPEIASRRLAWRDLMLSFDGETLREAAAEVTRQTGVAFDFADPALQDQRVGGYISAADETDFVHLLHTSLGVEAQYLAPDRIRLAYGEVRR